MLPICFEGRCDMCAVNVRWSDRNHACTDGEKGAARVSDGGLGARYAALPEWLRWVLCWPISLIGAVVLWFVFKIGPLRYGGELPQFVLHLVHPVFVQVTFLVLLYATVPRAKFGITTACVALRSLLLLLFLVLFPLCGLFLLLASFLMLFSP